MISVKLPPEFPIQVTKWVYGKWELKSWEKHFEDIGVETLRIQRYIGNEANKYIGYTLLRELTDKEKKEIESGKLFINDGFLQYSKDYFDKRYPPLKKKYVTFTCLRCGATASGYNKEGRNFCNNCIIAAENDCSDGAGFGFKPFKRSDV